MKKVTIEAFSRCNPIHINSIDWVACIYAKVRESNERREVAFPYCVHMFNDFIASSVRNMEMLLTFALG